ncbi:X-ray radiation resistance-associated protein 1 isoform X2 [Girardinichthys multiradiatus]|uniref:X-ray radiation resistance-associated protein 1 isoform X2 n=1 Tax=Girardinichthys multiradiatus TaxID=208333 RepID=UPI001FAD27D6|nr:X-ray radiation resistance-associated protein 1 isoform X2 [Girardinichthys multiradiatus]
MKKTWNSANKEPSTPGGITLDGRFLLQLHCVDDPSQLCSVDISEQKLNSVKPVELKAFKNVAYIDASDNFLSLGLFSCFIGLRELILPLNRISNIAFDAADFPHLEILDLSYNRLSSADLLLLGQIPHLKTLHLTGNRLLSLPPNCGGLHSDQSYLLSEEGAKQFEALEVLMLDDNKLTSRVFYSLRNLKRLKHLNLQGNRISEIPCMEVTESSKPGPISALRQGEEEAHAESNVDHLFKIIELFHTDSEDGCRGSSLFLPELQRLSLADNKIASEEALIAAALFPKLCELDIHSNPLITHMRGDMPLLTYLQERLGIKVEENTSKLSQRPFILGAMCVRHIQDNKSRQRDWRTTRSEDKNKSKCQENAEHFFITQPEDKAELQLDSSSYQKESPQNKHGNGTSPGQFPCYDVLMDAKPIPYIGIQTAVRMLEQTLRNPNIYRDSKPRLDSIQTPYREMKKRIKELPPLRPVKKPAHRAEELIKEIKESTTVKVVALGSAIHSRGVNKEDYKEALFLLRDMKKKQKMLHEKTMEQEARVRFEQSTAEHPPF